jgi:hypothetical protein
MTPMDKVMNMRRYEESRRSLEETGLGDLSHSLLDDFMGRRAERGRIS